jgi:hypothetical protein
MTNYKYKMPKYIPNTTLYDTNSADYITNTTGSYLTVEHLAAARKSIIDGLIHPPIWLKYIPSYPLLTYEFQSTPNVLGTVLEVIADREVAGQLVRISMLVDYRADTAQVTGYMAERLSKIYGELSEYIDCPEIDMSLSYDDYLSEMYK